MHTSSKPKLIIPLSVPEWSDSWECFCRDSDSGFFPCDSDGVEVEPYPHNWLTDWYWCAGCDRLIDQDTRRVVGYRPDTDLTPEERSEIDAEIAQFGYPTPSRLNYLQVINHKRLAEMGLDYTWDNLQQHGLQYGDLYLRKETEDTWVFGHNNPIREWEQTYYIVTKPTEENPDVTVQAITL